MARNDKTKHTYCLKRMGVEEAIKAYKINLNENNNWKGDENGKVYDD